MELNLLPILNYDGKKIEISEDISLSEQNNDDFRIISPLHFEGYAVNVSSTIELVGNATVSVMLICDRCTESYDADIEFEVFERYKKEDAFSDDEQNPDITVLEGTSIDFDEVLYTNLYMNLPSKNLCSDDCKGLCSVCGKNLNLGGCSCNTETTDPRFDILDKLL